MNFLTLDDISVGKKTVFVRADLNCPVENGAPQESPRLIEHSKTIYELSKKGAKTVVLAHQGRKGKDDFLSLRAHARLLSNQISKLSGKKFLVKFCADVCGREAQASVKSLKGGEVLLLENMRFEESETEFEKSGKSKIVSNLLPLCDIFVLDAFSVAHRAHASVVGFSSKPCAAGRVMEGELKALTSLEAPKRPSILVLGGAKPSDSLPILKNWIESSKADFALCGGAMGNLMLIASGKDIGERSRAFLESSGSLEGIDELKKFYSKNKAKLAIPKDVVADKNGVALSVSAGSLPTQYSILDIGGKTQKDFCALILGAGSIILNGPMGVYEKEEFCFGTKAVLQAVANSSAFSLLGGGHTLSALEKFGFSHEQFGYVSLSGKALIEYLSGESLPGIKMLEAKAYRTSEAPC